MVGGALPSVGFHDGSFLRGQTSARCTALPSGVIGDFGDQRAAYYQYAYSSAPAMVMRTIGAGSKYPFAARDAEGEFLNGSNWYKLHLPPDPPAALFWAVTAYNITDGTMPETPQLLPSINGFNEVKKNADGSIDLYFGPAKPTGAPDSNYIQTVKGRNFIVALRLYGTGVEFFDQTWKPDDVVKVKLLWLGRLT